MIAIGLMSGTSLDGVDAALISIEKGKFDLLKFITYSYPLKFKEKLKRNLSKDSALLNEISSLNFELGHYFVSAIDELLKNTEFQYDDIDYVASHGQTIWHAPDDIIPSTFQIGEVAIIVAKTNITCVSNFRVMDVACGGEGAPLVPISEYMLYSSKEKNIIMQNIGGIGNLTYLPKNPELEDIIAFDTGPGNVMIDYFVNKYYKLPYDEAGIIAKSGKTITLILEDMLKHDLFIKKVPPKSTGRELYSSSFMEEMSRKYSFNKYKKEDIINTITEFTVQSIVFNYKKYISNYDLVIVNGGGSHNKYIIQRLNEELENIVITGDEFGINSDAKEAFAFAVLGYLCLNHKFGNVKQVTGANKDAILGSITYGRYK